ncbi:scaffolding protein [Gordonia phage Birdsong]|uniref:Scaffolding protein n=1 Tax=Gordonia phage Apricot TaxID=2250319 RepID=A0A345L113_9CAUD|nr:head scaffolding protein [Gordonia phage Apricot]AXH48965.1 hypothetical protein SEA_APRICOT_5 [Gordonia phage Apricot]WNM69713.1 scaffolding protein [Gordonia phage Crater]WNM74407.1 scaffolding protein [Gordonia phage BearBQ]
MTDPVNNPADPAGGGNSEPIRLPDDHPLVTAFSAQKERNSGLQSQIDSLTTELEKAKTAKPDSGVPEWQQKFDELQTELTAEREAREKAEQQAQNATIAQLRSDRAAEKGLPAALAKKLAGTTQEEIDAEIDELLPFIGSGPKPNPQQGNPSRGRGGSLSAGRARYAETHK